MIKNKEFRKDLWFRLNTFPVKIPPLRERKHDIPALAEYFAQHFSVEMSLPYSYRFSENAMDELQRYNWPGNVRELKNTIEYALIVSQGKPLSFPSLYIDRQDLSISAIPDETSRLHTMNEMMTQHILKVLKHTNGRIEGQGGAAEILDMKPSTLRARMKKLKIKISKLPKSEI